MLQQVNARRAMRPTSEKTSREAMDAHGNTRCHRLRSLSVIGGFLDGQSSDLANGLTCLIGARGTGKTTVLELIRYAMDAMPADPAARKRIESLVGGNLAGGRVELQVETKDGLCYTVTRTVGEEPVVLAENGVPTTINLKAGGLFGIAVFSQNEIETIADRADSQMALIDSFAADRIADIDSQLRSLRAALAGNASHIAPLQEKIETLSGELSGLPSLDAKLQGCAQLDGDNGTAINQAHNHKALRDRERRAVEDTGALLDQYREHMDSLAGRLARKLGTIFTDEICSGPNGELLQQMQQQLQACAEEGDRLLEAVSAGVATAMTALEEPVQQLDLAHKQQDMAFRALVEKHKEAQGRAAERIRLEKARNDLLAKRHEREDLQRQSAEFQEQRTAMLQSLSELRDERFRVRQETADRLNEALQPTIRVTLVQYGDPTEYRALLEEVLSNRGLQRRVVAAKVVNAFWPTELDEIVERWDVQALIDKAELNADQAEKVVAALAGSQSRFELQTVDLADLPKIELNDGGTYKETALLSTGQKCTTILPILLMHSDRPLLIDQPEDNLDNRFVFETVVHGIARAKACRQLLFVTHNPNIPVLGEADKVIVLESNGTSARVANAGSVDDCKESIVTLLEGGEDAFRRRQQRYAY